MNYTAIPKPDVPRSTTEKDERRFAQAGPFGKIDLYRFRYERVSVRMVEDHCGQVILSHTACMPAG